MPKRKHVQIKLVEDQIQLMRAEGMTNREIADHFGLNLKQVKNWVNRHNKAQRNLAEGIMPKPKADHEKTESLSIRMRKRKLID